MRLFEFLYIYTQHGVIFSLSVGEIPTGRKYPPASLKREFYQIRLGEKKRGRRKGKERKGKERKGKESEKRNESRDISGELSGEIRNLLVCAILG